MVKGNKRDPLIRTVGWSIKIELDTNIASLVDANGVEYPIAGFIKQPAIADVSRAGLTTDQVTALQDKVDEMLASLRAGKLIET